MGSCPCYEAITEQENSRIFHSSCMTKDLVILFSPEHVKMFTHFPEWFGKGTSGFFLSWNHPKSFSKIYEFKLYMSKNVCHITIQYWLKHPSVPFFCMKNFIELKTIILQYVYISVILKVSTKFLEILFGYTSWNQSSIWWPTHFKLGIKVQWP